MVRKQPYDDSYDGHDPRGDQPRETSEAADDQSARTPEDDAPQVVAAEEPSALPSQDDLESQGFTPEQVRRLVVVSDRAAESTESRAAQAEMRRLSFTRWLIEHGMLDEWSA